MKALFILFTSGPFLAFIGGLTLLTLQLAGAYAQAEIPLLLHRKAVAPASPIQKVAFFENSQRRDADTFDSRAVVQVHYQAPHKTPKVCTGFFTAAKNSEIFITTAQHCADYDFETACLRNEITFQTELLRPGRNVSKIAGSCAQVVVGDPDSDTVIFRANLDDFSKAKVIAQARFLQIKGSVPQLGTQLKLIGYPQDRERLGRLTTTESCFVVENEIPSSDFMSQPDVQKSARLAPTLDAYQAGKQAQARMKTPKGYFNCTVYGGNSGGPILISGTDFVIGQPRQYQVDSYRRVPSYASEPFFTFTLFIENQRPTLEQLGILIEP